MGMGMGAFCCRSETFTSMSLFGLKTDLPVDVGSGLDQPQHAVRVSSKRSGVCWRLVEVAGRHVYLTTHLHQVHHTLQLQGHTHETQASKKIIQSICQKTEIM